jgi:hypothetical protein
VGAALPVNAGKENANVNTNAQERTQSKRRLSDIGLSP